MATTLLNINSSAVPVVEDKKPSAADDGTGAFARYATEHMADAAGIKSTMRGSRITSGRFKGKTQQEAMEMLRQEFAGLDDATKANYAAMARGEDIKPAATSMPFAQGSTLKDMRGKSVSFAPSSSAPARAAAMTAQSAATAQAGTAAVKAAQANQAADPTGVAVRAQAAKDAVLAKSGITDMGGGYKSMQNQYGTGYAEPTDPSKPRTPGRIFDEKGEVDVAGMMAKKGQQLDANGQAIGIPYLPNGSDAIAAGVAGGIQQGIAAAAPGMAERRAADIEKGAASFAASLPPAMQTPPIAMPTVPGATVPFRTANDTPGAASAAARAGMMTPKPSIMRGVAASAIAALPASLQPPAAKAKPKTMLAKA